MRISVLTEDFPDKTSWKTLKLYLKKDKKLSGHKAVTRSLLRGLRQAKLSFNYNPPLRLINKNVIVLSGVETLKRAIKLKEQGKIERLLAGPNILVFSDEHDSIISNPAIDYCIVPSDWVGSLYIRDNPQLKERIRVWAAGIDETYWTPVLQANNNKVLIYRKDSGFDFKPLIQCLEKVHFAHTSIAYGDYSEEDYRNILNKTSAAIFVSASESQGIALLEAWAMDVPTFVWDPGSAEIRSHMRQERIRNTSAAPYLSPSTGKKWKDIQELYKILEEFKARSYKYTPREWVINNMTDKRMAQALMNIFEEIK